MTKTFFLILILSLASGCSTLIVSTPAAQVQSSQTLGGQDEFGFKLGSQPYGRYEITRDASQRPPNLLNPDLAINDIGFEGAGIYSATPRFDTSVFLGTAGSGLSLRYQVLGETADKSQLGDSSFSVYSRFGMSGMSRSGDQKGEFGPGGFPWSGKTQSQFAEIGFSYGKKIANETLIFGGLSANKFNFKGDIKQDPTADGLDAGGTYSTNTLSGDTVTAALGLEFGRFQKNQFQLGITQYRFDDLKMASGFVGYSYSYRHAEDHLEVKKNYELFPKSSWQGRDFGALFLSYVVGFGSGQYVQDNWQEKGEFFALADGMSLLVAVSSVSGGDVGQNLGLAMGVYAVSRIWQMVDVIIDASSQQGRRLTTVDGKSN